MTTIETDTSKEFFLTWKHVAFLLLLVITICMTVGYFITQQQLDDERAMNRAVIRQHLDRLMIEEGLIEAVIVIKTESGTLYLTDGSGTRVGSLPFDKDVTVTLKKKR